jgi:sulfite reductase (NADPH) hemoprotein beta-component
MTAGRLSFADVADVDLFVETLARYERGEIDADAWKAFRLLNGVYGQRQAAVYMVRVKLPQGIAPASQLRVFADVVARHSDGRAHVTTRQNVQFYALELARVPEALRELAEGGLTTKEACGHSIRNVTAGPLAGVDPAEAFDVTPYAEAFTRHFLRGPRSSSLPRKFKVAFEGSPDDRVYAAIHDLAFIAHVHEGRRAFRVLVAGGTSTLPRSGHVLAESLPAADVLTLAEAVVRVFHRDGQREDKKKARLKWLVKTIGFPELARRIAEERAAIEREGAPTLPFDPEAPPELELPSRRAAEAVAPGPGFADWRRTNVVPQKQPGLSAAFVTLRLGDLTPAQLRGLADLAERHSDGTVRTTVDQNLVLRHVPDSELAELHRALVALGLGDPGARTLADVTSCAGADTCALAVTASRGLGALLDDHLATNPDGRSITGARIKISGCPNGCGQHHVAAIAFQGGMRRVGGRPLPLYQLGIGGGLSHDGTATFARPVGKYPARRATAVVDRLIALHRREAPTEPLAAFLARVPVDVVRRALDDLARIDETSATEQDFVDLGQDRPFAVGDAAVLDDKEAP